MVVEVGPISVLQEHQIGNGPSHRRVARLAPVPGVLRSASPRSLQEQTADQRHLRHDQRQADCDVPLVTHQHARLTEEDDAARGQAILRHPPPPKLPSSFFRGTLATAGRKR